MQSFAFVIFGSMLFMNSAFAADSLISSHTTHPVLEALPSASPQASFQIARTYYLPDYQQQLNDVGGDKSVDRTFDPENNRTDTCSKGGYYASPLGSGYNCSSVVYAHQACYSCTAKSCPSGYTAGLTKCADKTGYSASYSSNGLSGTRTCGKCNYKALPCASGYSTSYQSVSNCGTTGSAGWTFTSNGYSGEKKCGKCTAKSCLSGYSKTYSDVSKCGSKGSKGWSWEKSSQYAGNSVCGKCSKLSCNSPYTSGITSCSPSDGYALKQDSRRYNGDTVCGYCQPNNCSGTKQKDCNTSNGYTFTKTCKSGTTIYGDCKPNVCSGTKKSDCNTANGYIFTANCKSAGVDYGTCKAATCPTGYSTSYQSVANCGSTGSSGWTFSSKGESGGKVCGKCTAKTCSSCKTSVASCGSSGSKGWTLGTSVVCTAGDTKCYSCSAKSCTSGTTFAKSNCGSGAVWTANSYYSGNEQCGTCVTTCQRTKCNNMTVDNPFTIPGLFGKKSSYGDYIESTCPATIPYGTPRVKDDCGEDTCYNCSYKDVVQYITSTWTMSQIKSGTKNCYYRCSGIYDTYNSPKTEEDKILIRDAAICFTLCNLGQQYIFQHLSEFGLDEWDLSQDGIDEWFHCPGPTMTSTCVGGYANTYNPDSWKCPDCTAFVMNTPFGNRQMNGFKCSGGYPKCFPYNDNW